VLAGAARMRRKDQGRRALINCERVA